MLARIVITFACAGLAACATSPTTDSGRYLQILGGEKVIAEIGSSRWPCQWLSLVGYALELSDVQTTPCA